MADVLLGEASPSGRLPVTFPFNNYTAQADFASMSMRRWPGRTHRYLQVLPEWEASVVDWLAAWACLPVPACWCAAPRSGAERGQRAAARLHALPQVPVLYPFGHGLSYTSFTYGPLAAAPAAAADPSSPAGGGGCPRCQRQPLLSVALNVTNAGSMAGGHAVLLMLSYSGPPSLQQQTTAWLRRWLPAAGRAGTAGAAQAMPFDLPCTPPSSAVGGRPGEPELPLQALVGFERVQLAPGEAAQVGFRLTARSFQPFSPLAKGDLGTAVSSSGGSGGSGGPGGCARPYCGTYLLRASGSELALQLRDAGSEFLSTS